MNTFLLKAIGLCGVDNSIHPNQLIMYFTFYPFIEFGILFRPDKEGQPRYPTMDWVRKLSVAVQNYNHNNNNRIKMKLAAHLCERRVDEVLKYGDDTFIKQLIKWGFQRVQINATAVNGVDTSIFDNGNSPSSSSSDSSGVDFVTNFFSVVSDNTNIEFIIQKNNETQPLWEGIIDRLNDNSSATTTTITTGTSTSTCTYNNISFLLDESKGTGVLPINGCWPSIPKSLQSLKSTCTIGYAGGIGPLNVKDVLENITESKQSNNNNENENEYENNTDTDTDTIFWIDMESKLRSIKNDKDVFDLDKCYQVIDSVCEIINTNNTNSNLVLLDSSSSSSSSSTTTLIN
jgi:hypothetical protein